ncbi:MAG: hypothetical protein AAF399_12035, partial [Bacteroidota bacterium]
MNHWDDIQQQWQTQPTKTEAEQHLNADAIRKQLQQRMDEFAVLNDSPGTLLTGAIVLGLLGLLIITAALLGQFDPTEARIFFPVGLMMMVVGGRLFLTYRRRKQEPPMADLDTRAFVEQSLRRLKRHQFLQLSTAFAGGVILLLTGGVWVQEGWEFDLQEMIGIGAFVAFLMGIFGVIHWWNRHHNPAQPGKLKRELE